MNSERRFLMRFVLLCVAMTGVFLSIMYLQHESIFETDTLLKGLGILALYFYIAFRFSEQLKKSVLKWGWLAASCMMLPILKLIFTAPMTFVSSVFILGALYHAIVYIKKQELQHLIVLVVCTLIAVSLNPNLIIEACLLLVWITWCLYQEKQHRGLMGIAISALLLCLFAFFFIPKINTIALPSEPSKIFSWRAYAASLSLLLSVGHAAWLRFYFYFLSLLGVGLLFFCTKNTAYSGYLKNAHLFVALLFTGTLLCNSIEHAMSRAAYPHSYHSLEIYLLFVLGFLGLIQEVSSFAGRERTINLARLLLLIPLFQVYLIIDLF